MGDCVRESIQFLVLVLKQLVSCLQIVIQVLELAVLFFDGLAVGDDGVADKIGDCDAGDGSDHKSDQVERLCEEVGQCLGDEHGDEPGRHRDPQGRIERFR